jgi:hypothetical protein
LTGGTNCYFPNYLPDFSPRRCLHNLVIQGEVTADLCHRANLDDEGDRILKMDRWSDSPFLLPSADIAVVFARFSS